MNTHTTKAERRIQQLNKHYKALEKLAVLCGVTNPNGKKLSSALLSIEKDTSTKSKNYANGVIDSETWGAVSNNAFDRVQKLFNNNLQGLRINSDPRGYALKISDPLVKPGGIYDIGLQRDWGGYGLLSPTIDGN